ncbi:MAG: ABC transporter ATP-binding protein [Spirochaetia bacterium]|nr:ABC transporter ATP-binding protein [Spirochaetia bacterium]
MNDIAVSAVHTSYTYPYSKKKALDDASAAIPRKKVSALLGPNGSGKTTLLDLFLGWRVPETGTVLLNGKSIHLMNKRDRSRTLSLVPQNEPVQFSFTTLDYVMFGRAPYLPQIGIPGEIDTRIAMESLQAVGLKDFCRRSVTSLSSGERQLVLLARSLAQEPEIILLDEPTSNLDPANTGKVLDILSELASRGLTVLFSTHDPSAAARVSDYTIMLNQGSVFAAGPPEEIMTSETLFGLYGIRMDVIRHEGSIIVFHKTSWGENKKGRRQI